MPVQHNYTMKAGTKSKLLLVYATSAESTSGRTGLAKDLSAGSAAYIREGDSEARRSRSYQVASANGDQAPWLKSIPSCCLGCINSARRMKCLPKVLRALFC